MATACQFILPRTRVTQSVAMNSLRERVYSAWKSGSAASPAIKTLGLRIVKLDEGGSLLEMGVSVRLHKLSGTMHGGVMGDTADAALGDARAPTPGRNEAFTQIE